MRMIEQRDDRPHPSQNAGVMLAQLGEAAMHLYRVSFKETGLKPAHVTALKALRAAPVGQQALSESTEMDAVKLVGVLNDLEAGGLVERRRDSADRRRHIVALTKCGHERLAAVERAANSVEERLFAGLSRSERLQLAVLLDRIMETSRLGRGCPDSDGAADCADDIKPIASSCGYGDDRA